jgi:uroporphyrinogen decarboxylase
VYLDCFKRHYEIVFREAGTPDGFFLYEDFGFCNGLFCSPQTMKELVFPYERALVSFFKDYGLPVILHSCGDVRKAVPQIIEAGFDCLQPMEAKAGCNVLDIAKTYGNKLAYMGNIDVVQLSTNDPAKVRDEIVPKLTELKKMRIPYFFHSDHSLPPDISFATYQYALQLFRDNRSYTARG